MRYRFSLSIGVVTDVHPRQLGPDLREDADVGPVDHVRLEEFQEGGVGVLAFEFAHVFDVFEFLDHEGAVRVAFAVHEGEYGVAFFPAIFAREPTRGFGEEAHADEEQDRGDHLHAPRDPERGGALDFGAAIGYVEHLGIDQLGLSEINFNHKYNHDAPGDCPLLSPHQTAPFAWWGQFGDVHRDLGRADADTETVDEAADYQHANVLGCTNDDGANDPVDASVRLRR